MRSKIRCQFVRVVNPHSISDWGDNFYSSLFDLEFILLFAEIDGSDKCLG
jgi:hypothetical protein